LRQAERRDALDSRSHAVLAEEDARREATAAKTAKLRLLRLAKEAKDREAMKELRVRLQKARKGKQG